MTSGTEAAVAIGTFKEGVTLDEIRNAVSELQEAMIQGAPVLRAFQKLRALAAQSDGHRFLASFLTPSDEPSALVIPSARLLSEAEMLLLMVYMTANIGAHVNVLMKGVSESQLKMLTGPYLNAKDIKGSPIFDRLLISALEKGDLAKAANQNANGLTKFVDSPQDVIILSEGALLEAVQDQVAATRIESHIGQAVELEAGRLFAGLLSSKIRVKFNRGWDLLNRIIPDALRPNLQAGFLEMNNRALSAISVRLNQIFAQKTIEVNA
ncbi:MAG: hypothetical protein EXS63_01385 [Candidatus Omnitrophica bacterium]|nr:hypothetical protein [Candidatus Omnitrophota bacterium]